MGRSEWHLLVWSFLAGPQNDHLVILIEYACCQVIISNCMQKAVGLGKALLGQGFFGMRNYANYQKP